MTTIADSLHTSAPFHSQTSARGFSDFAAGEIVSAKVMEKLNERHYVVLLRGEVREVQSENHLQVGANINAVVVSVADKLVLRQVPIPSLTKGDPESAALIKSSLLSLTPDKVNDVATQADFYKLKLSNPERRLLQVAVNSSNDPDRMMLAGLFLSKRGLPIEPVALNQLYAVQQQSNNLKDIVFDKTRDAAIVSEGGSTTLGALAQAMRLVIDARSGEMSRIANSRNPQIDIHVEKETAPSGTDATTSLPLSMNDQRAAGDTTGDGKQNPRMLNELHELLSDIGPNGLGVRYGTLPVLINGELVELELVMFKHRQQQSDPTPIQRLVMSIHTDALGTVSITAESLNQRLLVTISAETTDHAETLGTYAGDVRALAERLGWTVESVAYDVRSQNVKLAQRVMQHAVRQGVIDHVW